MADPLLNMAIDAGLFPQVQEEPVPEAPVEVSSIPAELAGDALSGGLSFDPPPLPGGPEGAESNYGGVMSPGGGNLSLGASMSERGFSPAQFKNVSKHDAGLMANYQRDDAQAQERFAPAVAAETMARAAQIDATESVAQAQAAKLAAQGQQAALMQELQTEFAATELQANAEAEAASQQAKTDYLAALADFRASQVNPGQLWDNMSSGVKFGTLISAFVHDFLGAKGIKTSAMDTLNKAIERNINAQLTAIQTKGQVADGFKSLWWMQRAQAKSDAEARSRVKGFMLEAAKQAVVANMAQYESGLATAQGQAAIAAIDKEFAKNLVDIFKNIDHSANQMRQQSLQLHTAKMQAAIQSRANSLRAAELEFEKQKYAEGKVPKISEADFVFNPETGKGEWYFKSGTPESVKKEVKNNIIGVTEVNRAIQELRDLERKLKPSIDGVTGSRFEKEDARKYEAIRLRLAHAMVKANGERATDRDVEHYLKSLPRHTMFTNGGVDRILAFAQQEALNPTFEYVRQWANDVPPEAQPTAAQGRPFAGAYTDASVTAQQGEGVPATGTDFGQRALASPDRLENTADSLQKKALAEGVMPNVSWSKFAKEAISGEGKRYREGGEGSQFATTADKLITGATVGEGGAGGGLSTKAPPAYFTGLLMLGQRAKTDPQARETLMMYANLGGDFVAYLPNGVDPNSEEGRLISESARWVLLNSMAEKD